MPLSEHVVIIGGGIIGSMTAWSLRQTGFGGKITVVEKDPSYRRCSTSLSAAAIRTQFSTPTCIAMSLYGVQFLRDVATHFGTGAYIGYVENGYLILGGPDVVAERRAAVQMQCAAGAEVLALAPEDIRRWFPYLNLDGVGIGTLGTRGEGWFDAWSLLTLARSAARAAGVTYVAARAEGLQVTAGRVTGVRLAGGQSGEVLACDWLVNAAGALSAGVVRDIGIDLPVTPRKRTVFHFRAPLEEPGFPMLFDSSGIWLRPEGDGFIGGVQPEPHDDPDATDDFEPHHHLLEEVFWPALAARIPAMQDLRLLRAWAGHYEVNALDHNGIVGPHDQIANLIFATGFSGHGVMHAPATARGVAEWITGGAFRTLDLSPLGWARIRDKRPMEQSLVY